MDLKEQKYVCTLAECKSLTRASERLYISQPALSLYINNVEKILGARLFERTNRRVALSEAGRLFLEEARRVLAQVDKAADVARRAQLGELGELKIGFTSSAPFNSSIPQAIFAFSPGVPGGAPQLAGDDIARKRRSVASGTGTDPYHQQSGTQPQTAYQRQNRHRFRCRPLFPRFRASTDTRHSTRQTRPKG